MTTYDIDQVYRDFRVDGVPASGNWEPDKAEIRGLLKQLTGTDPIIVGRALESPSGYGWTPDILPIKINGRWRGTKSVRNMKPTVTGDEIFVHPVFGADSSTLGKKLAITATTSTNPVTITVPGHGIPGSGYSIFIQGLDAPRELNDRWFRISSAPVGDVLELQAENGSGYAAFSGPGIAITVVQSPKYAIEKNDVAIINLAPALYNYATPWGVTTIDTSSPNLIIRRWPISPGKPLIAGALDSDRADWTVDGTYGNVWYTTITGFANVKRVVDTTNLDVNGAPTPLRRTRQAADSTMRNLASDDGNTWFISSDGKLYVSTADGRAPGRNILLLTASTNAQTNTGKTIHIEDVDFIGGNEGYSPRGADDPNSRLQMAGCRFMHGQGWGTGHGLRSLGIGEIYLEDCEAISNCADGLNYHSNVGATVIGKVLEVNCRGVNNGTQGTQNNNGSTVHDGITITRIHTVAFGNEGPQIADVGGGKTWCVGCEAGHTSEIYGGTAESIVISGVAAIGWYYDTAAYGSPTSLAASDSAIANVFGCYFDEGATQSGIIQTYDQN